MENETGMNGRRQQHGKGRGAWRPWAVIVCGLVPALHAQTVLVDFGTSNSFRGVSVISPDVNGRFWNGIAPGEYIFSLSNAAGQATGFSLGFETPVGSDSYNGPAGPTSDPPTPGEIDNTVFDPSGLYELGVTNAVFDYCTAPTGETVRFTLSNLDPARYYDLMFFGSRKFPEGEVAGRDESRTTVYAVTDSNRVVLASNQLVVGAFNVHNTSTVAVITGLRADISNRMHVAFGGLTATNEGYLNCLMLRGYASPPPPPAAQTLLIDFGNDQSNNGTNVVNPDANGNTWNSIWSGTYNSNLVDIANTPTALGLGFHVATGADSFNGPAGEIDADALGLLGGAAGAVDDYYLTSLIRIDNLDPAKTYSLTFFGSHAYSQDDATIYSVYPNDAYSGAIAWTSLNVQQPGAPWLHNSNRAARITGLAPQAENSLYVRFDGYAGGAGYLNAMQIDVHDLPGLAFAADIRTGGGVASVSFLGSHAIEYGLQRAPDLGGTNWQDVMDGGTPVAVTGDGVSILQLEDPNPADPLRVYRLIHIP